MACEQSVRVWSDDRGVEKGFKLLCRGVCKVGERPCKPDTTIEGAAGTLSVESCRCDGGKGKEDTGCHIVLCTRKDGTQFHRCDGGCDHPDKDKCLPLLVPNSKTTVAIPGKDGKYTGRTGSYSDYKCECQKKPE